MIEGLPIEENSQYYAESFLLLRKIFQVIEKDNILKRVAVKIGLESDIDVEVISSELVEGDAIVLSPDQSYVDGMKVEKNSEIVDEVK